MTKGVPKGIWQEKADKMAEGESENDIYPAEYRREQDIKKIRQDWRIDY